jgi:hypothetical protein
MEETFSIELEYDGLEAQIAASFFHSLHRLVSKTGNDYHLVRWQRAQFSAHCHLLLTWSFRSTFTDAISEVLKESVIHGGEVYNCVSVQ